MTFPISDQGDWRLRRLGELVTIDKGHVAQTQPFPNAETVPYIGADSFGGNYSQFTASPAAVFCEPTDVLMLWDGERSGLCASGLAGAIGSTVARLRPKSGIDGRFLYHQLSSYFGWIQARRTGTGVPHVPKDIASILTLPIPDSEIEQSRIAAVLGTVDAAIAQTEAIIAKLKQVRGGLLHDLLTRGLDEHGQLRPPPAEAPHLYQDSPLGKIPRKWELRMLSDCLASNPQNGIYKPAGAIGRGTLLIGQTSITADRSIDMLLARRAEISDAEREHYGLQTGDILVSRVFATLDGVGQPALVPDFNEPAVYESNMMRLRVRQAILAPILLFHWLRSVRIRKLLLSGVNLSNQASVNQQQASTNRR